jgi:hypothetical protein
MFPNDDSVQQAITAISQICEENLKNPPTDIPADATAEGTAVGQTEVPVATELPVTTPTP